MNALDCFERQVDGWTLVFYPEVESTNDIAKKMPEWSAVRAEKQTKGRGRHGRNWQSGEGGLWISIVIPTSGPREKWETLPLTVGYTILDVLQKLGLKNGRLRWPNDIMVGDKKLAGLLVERFNDDTSVIGIGLNVQNHPALSDPSLKGLTTRLADLIANPPDIETLTAMLLRKMRQMQETIEKESWLAYWEKINASWELNRRVECDIEDKKIQGTFEGIDRWGNLLLKDDQNQTLILDAAQVKLLKEI